jgi:gluconate 5-dehydrogenase
VAVIDRTPELMESVPAAVRVREAADLSDAGAARGAVRAVREQLGGLDAFVHCVGINDRRPIEEYTAQDWDRIIAVNLTSAFHTATEAAVGMRAAGYGRDRPRVRRAWRQRQRGRARIHGHRAHA